MGTAIEWFGLGDAEEGPEADLDQAERGDPAVTSMKDAFAKARAEDRAALIGYLPGGLSRPSRARSRRCR